MDYQGKLNNKSIANKHCYIAILFILTLLSLPQTVLSQQEERLAVVSKYEGDVKVEHESVSKTVKQIGNRIRNSAVYEEDSVKTMHSSTANLVFNDNTSLDIDEDTALTISSREMSEEERTEGGFIRQVSGKQSAVVRSINVKAGKFMANITPSKSVLTRFETPTGVASVRGTKFAFTYVGGVTSIDLSQGLIDFSSSGGDVSFVVEPGDFINVSTPELGHTSIDVMAGRLNIETATGASMSIEEGGSLEVEVNDETGEMTVTGVVGVVTITNDDGTTIDVEAGTSLGIQDTAADEIAAAIANGASPASTHVMKNAEINEDGDLVIEEGGEAFIGDDLYLSNPDTSAPDYYNSSLKDKIDGLGDAGSGEAEGLLPTAWHDSANDQGWTRNSLDAYSGTAGYPDTVYASYVDTVFGQDSGGNDVVALADETTTMDASTATFSEDFGSQGNFAVVHNGHSDNSDSGTLAKTLTITDSGYLQIMFDYNFITRAFDATGADLDTFTAKLVTESGAIADIDLASEQGETVKTELTEIDNLPSDTLDVTDDDQGGGASGWKTYDKTYSIPYTSGTNDEITLSFEILDAGGNSLVDSAALLDNIYLNFVADGDGDDLSLTTGQGLMRNDWTETNTNTDWTSSRVNAYTASSFHVVNPPTARTPKTGAPFIETFGTNEAGGNNFAVIHTGKGTAANTGYLQYDFTVDALGENRTFSFDYNFVTTELPTNFPVPQLRGRNDYFRAELLHDENDNGTFTLKSLLAYESRKDSTLTSQSGSFPSETFGSDGLGYITGWKAITSAGIDLTGGIDYQLKFSVFDAADGTGDASDAAGLPPLADVDTSAAGKDSAVLIDNVVDPPEASPSTNYMLTFARMLSGEVDIHDADLEADAVASAEHQAFVARVNEVISEMDNISVSVFMDSRDEFLDRLWTARDIVTGHEETTGFLQKTAVAHHLLEANLVLNEGVNPTSLVAIADSLNQAKSFLVTHINDFGEVDALANIRTNIDSVLANIDNINNNAFTTDTLVAVRNGIKQAFSDTIDHMNGVCNDPTLPCYVDMSM